MTAGGGLKVEGWQRAERTPSSSLLLIHKNAIARARHGVCVITTYIRCKYDFTNNAHCRETLRR